MFTKETIERYYMAEKNIGLLFLCVGIIGLVASAIFFFVMKTNWHKGAAIPFLLIGLFQVFQGYHVYKGADEHRKAAVYAYDMNPSELKEKELPKMEKGIKSMTSFMVTEAILLIAGIALFVYFKRDATKLFWAGLGMALFVETVLCLFVEITVRNKTTEYAKGLKEFVKL
jgi:uncharacterized membrane protein HdeD (DUF308 family)